MTKSFEGLVPSRWTSKMEPRLPVQNHVSIGGSSDSYYEYLLKGWILSGEDEINAGYLKESYIQASNGFLNHALKTVGQDETSYMYLSTMSHLRVKNDQIQKYDELDASWEHLSCFSSGLYALGHFTLQDKLGSSHNHLQIAQGIARTCRSMYTTTRVGLAPNEVFFSEGKMLGKDRMSTLRPEYVESLFYLWRLTKDQKYRDWGWEVFNAIEKSAKLEGGYTSLSSVYHYSSYHDFLDSYVYSETFFYLYLLFSEDSVFPLTEWVFNTEGHPLRIFKSK